MKRKIIILIGLVLVLCGCDAEVNIKVSKNDIEETIKITDYTSNYSSENVLLSTYRNYIPAFASEVIVDTEGDIKKNNVEYYSKDKLSLNNGYLFTYKYKFEFNDYYRSTSVKNAYRSAFIQHDRKEKNIILSTDSSGCMYFQQYKTLNSIKVNITSTYKVLESNADSVNGNVYTWNLSRNNNKNIYIKYDTTAVASSSKEDNKEDEDVVGDETVISDEEKSDAIPTFYAILIIILVMLIFIVFVIVITKMDKRKYE